MREQPDPERDIRRRETAIESKRGPDEIMAEVNEDFERLRTVNDDLKRATEALAASAPVHQSVAEAAAEVRRRAARLEKNLAGLPKPEKDEKRPKYTAPATDAQMKALLMSFHEVLTSFLTNPVFSDVGTLDPQLAVKARRDLEGVLTLSEVVRKGAEKLAKR